MGKTGGDAGAPAVHKTKIGKKGCELFLIIPIDDEVRIGGESGESVLIDCESAPDDDIDAFA